MLQKRHMQDQFRIGPLFLCFLLLKAGSKARAALQEEGEEEET